MATTNNFLEEELGRRERRRFPIRQDVRYQCVKGSRIHAVGVGRTVEIGSREIRFTTQHPLKAGEKVLVSVNWPAMLDSTCAMKLEIFGWVIRTEPGGVVVRIERHEFRTRGNSLAMMHTAAG
jgi:hypothetical protein